MGKTETGGPERRGMGFDPAAVPAVSDERHFPGGELNADLMRPA